MSKVKSKEEFSPLPENAYNENPIHYTDLEYEIRTLSGKLLTIIDASIIEERSNKAIKDLIKSEIRNILFHYQDYCSGGKEGHGIPDERLEIK